MKAFPRAELIAIPDLHFPWAHQRAVAWTIAEIKKYRPRYVVQLGDLLDQYCFSSFARNPNLMTPKEEMDRGLAQARKMWSEIVRVTPGDCQLIQLAGNHDARIHKRIAERLPELQGQVTMNHLEFPGVKTYADDREYLDLTLDSGAKVTVVHGWLGKAGAHMQYFNSSVVFGHLHRPSILFDPQPRGRPLFELNAGYLGDPHAPVFNYGATKRKKWQVGYGRIDAGGTPVFVPYLGK